MKKKIVATLLACAMVVSLAACGNSSGASKTEETKEETKTEETAASTDIKDMTEDEIKAAMEKEPAWGSTIYAEYDGGDCTSGPDIAKALGYYDKWGINVEIVKGTEITEAIGTNKAQFGCHHIAHMLVPITNGVDMVFTGVCQTGCKSFYVKNDSSYKNMADMVGKTVGIDGPIGSSAHNMSIRFCIADNVDFNQITFTPVEQTAAVQALLNGEVEAVMLSDRYAKQFVDDGSLRYLRSITWDDDFKDEACCSLAMNGTFVKENPVMAQVLTQCVMDAYMWIGNNKDEAVKLMLSEGCVSGSEELTKYMLDQQDWTVNYDAAKKTITNVATDYIGAGIIDSKWTVDQVVEKVWQPLGEKK